uniref:Uncharacterized protein n=1 Tax=Tanacetum cinerariifolium TaxID=118510 RepID=A0A6L2N3L2_TANCI|nr:hypothetical protein [Tanacetum cinerariifolium]
MDSIENLVSLPKLVIEKGEAVLKTLLGEAASESGAMLADVVRYIRFKNQMTIFFKASQLAEKKGLKMKPTGLKTLVPLIEACSLEEDEKIQDKWAAIIANVAALESDPVFNRNCIKLFGQLSAEELVIMDHCYEEFHKSGGETKFSLSDLKIRLYIENLTSLGLLQLEEIEYDPDSIEEGGNIKAEGYFEASWVFVADFALGLQALAGIRKYLLQPGIWFACSTTYWVKGAGLGMGLSASTWLAFDTGVFQDAVPSADFHFLRTVLDGERMAGNRVLGGVPEDFVFAVPVQIPAIGFEYLDDVGGGSLHRQYCLFYHAKPQFGVASEKGVTEFKAALPRVGRDYCANMSTGNSWPSDKQEAYAATMRDLWKQENDLMSARFGWFTTLQGLLFAALGFAWQHELRAIVNTLCGLGLAVVVSTMVVFWFGMKAWRTLGDIWDTKLATYTGPPITGYKNTKKVWWKNIVPTPWWVLPVAFLGVWVYIVWYLNHYGLTSVDQPTVQQTEQKQPLDASVRQPGSVNQVAPTVNPEPVILPATAGSAR